MDAERRELEVLRERKEMETEAAQLRMEMSEALLEADKRMRQLSQEVQDAKLRAARAEQQLVEAGDMVPEATRPLLRQIDDLEAAFQPLQHDLAEQRATTQHLNTRIAELLSTTETLSADNSTLQTQWNEVGAVHAKALQALRDKHAKEMLDQQHDTEQREREMAALRRADSDHRRRVEESAERVRILEEEAAVGAAMPTPQRATPILTPAEAVVAPPVAPSPAPSLSDARSATPSEMDKYHHLQQELHRYVVENAALKKTTAGATTLQSRYRELHKSHEAMLQLYGEKEEECTAMKTKFAEAEAGFKRQMDFFIEKLK